MIHAVIHNIAQKFFFCSAKDCTFISDDLTEIAQHVVSNQFVYTPK
jgi:hypothetical protein